MTGNEPRGRVGEVLNHASRGCGRIAAVLMVFACILPAAAARAEDKLVEISGGADETRHNYEWLVVNHHTAPITYIEFPHYRADLFAVPPNWTKETTYLVNVGVPDRPGVCIARPEPPNPGIVRGGAQRFGMRISAQGAAVSTGQVKVKFSDGKETIVTGVALPEPPLNRSRLLPLLGAALIFGLWVVIRTIRDRRRASAQAAGSVQGGEGEDAGN